MLPITLTQCRYFRAVAQTGGITAATDLVGVSQPAIAQAIDKLEAATGLTLFTRLHARGMELTPEGAAFLRHAEQLLGAADRLEEAAADIAAQREGTVRLGCFQSLAPFYLARILTGYRAERPGVVLDVHEMLQADLTAALQRNDLDLALMYDLGQDTGELELIPLATLRPYLIVPPGHRLAGRANVPLQEIDGEDYVLFDAPQSRDYYFQHFARAGIRPRVALRSASIETVRSYVASGLGVSVLAMRPTSDRTYDGQRVVPVDLAEDFGPTRIALAIRKDAASTAMTAPLIAYCQQLFGGMAA